ncbi:MAG: ABC transporter substrate-binding protein [Cystobacter sp.]
MQSVAFTAALLLLLSACTRVPDKPLKVGTYPWAASEPLFLARELNHYPPSSVHLVEFSSEHQLARAFRNKVIDAATVPLFEALRFEQLGQEPRVVLMFGASQGADCLIARPEVDSISALRQKRVGHAGGPTTSYLLARISDRGGLQVEDFTETVLPPESLEDALKSGRVDAVLTTEPLCGRLMGTTGARRLFDSSHLSGELVDVLVVRQKILDEQPEQVDTLINGWLSALKHYQAHAAEDAGRMAPRLAMSAASFQETLEKIHMADVDEQRLHLMGPTPRLRDMLKQVGDMMVDKQLLSERPNTERMIDSAPLARVLR